MMLGLLLARAGVQVTVMEKHADFLRDFRGDTVHASTLRLLDELGLGDAVRRDPAPGDRHPPDENSRHAGRYRSQPAARAAQAHRVGAAVGLPRAAGRAPPRPNRPSGCCAAPRCSAPIRNGDKVIGVTYRNPAGETGTLHADLTVACDGRSSTLRAAAGLKPRSFGAPMDVWWFRLPRKPDDPPRPCRCARRRARVRSSSTAATTTRSPTSSRRARDAAAARPGIEALPPRGGVAGAVAGRPGRAH